MAKEVQKEKTPPKRKANLKFNHEILRPMIGSNTLEILGQVESRQGAFVTIKTYIKGKHEHLGKIISGMRGEETEITTYQIRPHQTFDVTKTPKEKEDETSRLAAPNKHMKVKQI